MKKPERLTADWPPTPEEAEVLRAVLQSVTIPGSIARIVATLQEKVERLLGGQP